MISVPMIFWLIQLSAVSATLQPESPVASPVDGILFKSGDNGMTWSNLDHGLPTALNPFTFLACNGTYYLGTSDGLYRGSDLLPVTIWQKEVLDQKRIFDIFPGRDGPYFIGEWEGISQYQTITGQWHTISSRLEDKMIHTMVETQEGFVLAGTESGMYRTTDHGKSWQQVFKGQVTRLSASNGALICSSQAGLWRSTDSGEKWNRVFTSTNYIFLVHQLGKEWVAITDGQDFAGTRGPNMVYVSADEGLTWQPASYELPFSLTSIHDLKQSGTYLVACSREGIFRSADGGKTWNQVFDTPASKAGFFKLYGSGENLFAMYMEGC